MEKVFVFRPYFILVLSRLTAEGLAVRSCRLRRFVQPGLGCRDGLVRGGHNAKKLQIEYVKTLI